ncbi:hypothetical protein BTS2_1691 [Bacillus sp. TS-2]|nr:hypothetical protein BTS2_1691 [Bacillus sp. TS-2]
MLERKVEMRKTNIQPWSEEWKVLFLLEEVKLKDIFKEDCIDIHHIGSTSIATVGCAKPIIDILIVVSKIECVTNHHSEMNDLGYETKGENGIKGRRYFEKGGNNRTHHVHIFEEGHPQIVTHLNFKNYLLEHADVAKEYGQLKWTLLKSYPHSHDDYQNKKQSMVKDIAEQAQLWSMKKY